MHRFKLVLALAMGSAAIAAPAGAVGNSVSGSFNGYNYTAQSYIVGQTSTYPVASGGNPIYTAPMPQYSGVVSLSVTYPSGTFGCTGTLLPDRQSILTAAHCLIGGPSVTAYFYGGNNPDTVVAGSPSATAITVSQQFIAPGYTGEVIDQNDIAVLRLSQVAPAFAVSYGLFGGNDLTGLGYNIAGYGLGSSAGGSIGYNGSGGVLRQGNNRYDYRLGDSSFAGQLIAAIREDNPGNAAIDFSYLADFDNGTAGNDAACVVAAGFGLSGNRYCNLGVGTSEVGIAPGDSGSPQFINGLIASVASYGLSFEREGGDIDDAVNGTFGEFGGFVPIFLNRDFILSSMVSVVPEPTTWAMLIAGMGLLGGAMRRRTGSIEATT